MRFCPELPPCSVGVQLYLSCRHRSVSARSSSVTESCWLLTLTLCLATCFPGSLTFCSLVNRYSSLVSCRPTALYLMVPQEVGPGVFDWSRRVQNPQDILSTVLFTGRRSCFCFSPRNKQVVFLSQRRKIFSFSERKMFHKKDFFFHKEQSNLLLSLFFSPHSSRNMKRKSIMT